MVVGRAVLELIIPGADSLKAKRRVLRPLLQDLRARFQVAAAEVDDLDLWARSTLGVACVSNDGRHANEILSRLVHWVEGVGTVELEDYLIEID
ncbi:MAG: DUF503 domain-containing protein [Firmicutes bacterium]|nr:DUF503 domain-containing protein [Bacillota bacterium]